MSYGLSGSSGTGKTTLAKQLADEIGIVYHDASVTRLMRAAGYDPISGMGIDDRLDAQEKLLAAYVAELRTLERPFITDRTPIDMAAYALGEITMTNTTAKQGDRVMKYIKSCFLAQRNIFDATIVLRPLPFYEATETRPPPNLAYQMQIQLLIESLLDQARADHPICYAVIYKTDRARRLDIALNFLMERVQAWESAAEVAVMH